MEVQVESLLVSDPQCFMNLAMLDNPKERMDGLKTTDDIVLCEIVRYGIYVDADARRRNAAIS
jgi:hypothetical protein